MALYQPDAFGSFWFGMRRELGISWAADMKGVRAFKKMGFGVKDLGSNLDFMALFLAVPSQASDFPSMGFTFIICKKVPPSKVDVKIKMNELVYMEACLHPFSITIAAHVTLLCKYLYPSEGLLCPVGTRGPPPGGLEMLGSSQGS